MADLAEMRQSLEATRATLREQEIALRTAEDEQKQAEQRGTASRLGQEHEQFARLASEESMSGALLARRQRELGILKPAPITPPPHLAPLIERMRAQVQLA